MAKIIGRMREQEILNQLLKSNKAEFLAIYGRRRIGKTYLIKNFLDDGRCVFFHSSGIQKGSLREQLEQFSKQIGETFYDGADLKVSRSWLHAFEELTKVINKIPKNKKVVIFLDELPWMATKRSKLLQALDYYWNRYWVHNDRCKLIICGSAASWILDNVINNKGGLHNRITYSIRLEPFTLYETEQFLKSMGITLNHRHILDLFMVLGGVPHYLAKVRKGLSASQSIDELCFQKDGPLMDEFGRLFSSLFNSSEIYIKLIKSIAKHRYGIGQTQVIKDSGVSPGGRTARRLQELEEAGFIMSFIPYGREEKGIYYKVIDEYTLFYLYWVGPKLSAMRRQDLTAGYWLSRAQLPGWKSWAGYAFEAICYKHLSAIRKTLKIEPGAEVGSWRHVSKIDQDDQGAQIDLLFDRPDGAITICEIKYSDSPFVIEKQYAHNLMNKVKVYQKNTNTNKQMFITFITKSGLKPNFYSEEIVTAEVVLDDLFII